MGIGARVRASNTKFAIGIFFLTQKLIDFGVLFIGNGQGTEPTEFASIILVINPISNPFLIRLLGDFSNEQSLSNLS